TSKITTALDTGAVMAERDAFEAAQSALAVRQLPLTIAEQKVDSSRAIAASLHARIAADRVKYGIDAGDAAALALAAGDAERAATVAIAVANLSAARLAKAQAEQLPADNADRAKQLEAAGKQLSDSEAALATAAS